MAFNFMNFGKCSARFIFNRSMKHLNKSLRRVPFSTSEVMFGGKENPVKFSTNKAAKVSISENLNLEEKKSDRLWYEKYVVVASLLIFITYFFILRVENDIDEILKGNPDYQSPKMVLINLKNQLTYCEMNNLPTAALKAKIRELEEEPQSSPFRM